MRPSLQVYNIFFDMVLETLKQFNKEPIQTSISIKLEISDHYLNLFLSGGMYKCSLVLFIYPPWETNNHGHDDFYDFPFPLFIKVMKVMYSYHINNFKNDVLIEFHCDSLFYRYHYMIITHFLLMGVSGVLVTLFNQMDTIFNLHLSHSHGITGL